MCGARHHAGEGAGQFQATGRGRALRGPLGPDDSCHQHFSIKHNTHFTSSVLMSSKFSPANPSSHPLTLLITECQEVFTFPLITPLKQFSFSSRVKLQDCGVFSQKDAPKVISVASLSSPPSPRGYLGSFYVCITF